MTHDKQFFNRPIRSIQTMLRIISKNDDTYFPITPDGIYGRETEKAVMIFQEKVGLPITGIVDQRTWEHIVEQYEEADLQINKAESIEIVFEPGKIFQANESSPYLYLLQAMLSYLSELYPEINKPGENGLLDKDTTESLKAFQLLSALPSTGELDRKTWKYLVNQFTLHANHFHGNDQTSS